MSSPGRRMARTYSIDSDSASTRKKPKLSMALFSMERVSKVLVIYTGGTIGMKQENGVYVPKENFLVDQLLQQPVFNDANFLEAYKEFSIDEEKETHDDSAFGAGTESTRSSQTDLSRPTVLAMPEDKKGRRVVFEVLEYSPLLDSSNMTHKDYVRIANDINTNYEEYSGFVILHGTDTMSYTASALAFMLECLGKPVILTGSQVPMFETLTDGRSNFIAALTLAAHYCIPEVSVFFNNKLFRGCKLLVFV